MSNILMDIKRITKILLRDVFFIQIFIVALCSVPLLEIIPITATSDGAMAT